MILVKINLLKKRFDDCFVLYAPELALPEAIGVAEKCYPAVRVHPHHVDLAEWYHILISEIGEYAEYSSHPWKGFLYSEMGGKEKIEKRLLKMYEKQNFRIQKRV